MQTINLRIDDSFYPHFKAIIESFVKDQKVEIIDNKFPQDLIVHSANEVRRRVYEAEKTVSITQEEYEKEMDIFKWQNL